MRDASGAHTGPCTSSFRSVRRRASPGASTGDTYSCATSPSRTDVNASQRPSGDHRGVPSRLGPNVRRRGSVDPSTGTAQIALRGSPLSSSTHETTYATVTPSGDRRGSLALVSRKTSCGCMPGIESLPGSGPDHRLTALRGASCGSRSSDPVGQDRVSDPIDQDVGLPGAVLPDDLDGPGTR